MTEKVYLKDMYQKEFAARVMAISGNKILLDRTCFFIQGSGQSGDSGEINGQNVIETQKGGWHLLAEPPRFKVGDEVQCRVDWDRRYKTMRLHSASHIVEHFINQVVGETDSLKTNVNNKKDFTDYKTGMPAKEAQQQILDKTNDFIKGNHGIDINADSEGMYHWTCGEIHTFCVGTHVRNTSEIGRISIAFEQKEEGVTRITITLG